MPISLKTIADALEEAFQYQDCDEARAIRNLIDAGLVDGRNKKRAKSILDRLANQAIRYDFNPLTRISKYFKLARINKGQHYRFLRYNSAILQ